jgi:hypothetical protein
MNSDKQQTNGETTAGRRDKNRLDWKPAKKPEKGAPRIGDDPFQAVPHKSQLIKHPLSVAGARTA